MIPVHCISRSQELKIDFITENVKNLLVRNHWTAFNIILQKCSFDDPLPRLFKPFGFVKKTWPPLLLYICKCFHLDISCQLIHIGIIFLSTVDFYLCLTKIDTLGVKNLNIIQSMYRNIKSKVKFNNTLSEEFSCYSYVDVRQGECLLSFLAHLSSAQDELLWSLFVRRPSVRPSVRPCVRPSVRPSVNIFKRLLLWSRWANFAQISYGASLGWGNERLLKWSRSVD